MYVHFFVINTVHTSICFHSSYKINNRSYTVGNRVITLIRTFKVKVTHTENKHIGPLPTHRSFGKG